MTVLAIDQGTSGTKAIVVDPADGVVGLAEVAVHPRYLGGGGVEQDPDELLESVRSAGRAALAQAGRPIAAVSLANQGETVLAWDPDTGRPLTAASSGRTAAPNPCAPNSPSMPVTSRPAPAWYSTRASRRRRWRGCDNVESGGVVTTSDSWLLHRLIGEFVTDAATASRSLLVELGAHDFDPALLALFGLDGERLPRIVGNDEIIGTTTAFGDEVPVGGVVVDQQAALQAEACLQPGMAK